MTYTHVMNMNNFTKCLGRFLPADIQKIMEIECEVTEKIHGENFRIGKTDDNRLFIGQKNGMFFEPDFDQHPNWNRMSKNAKKHTMRVLEYCKAFYNKEIIFYGELCGNGLQSGFTFPFEKYEVLFCDISVTKEYLSKDKTRDLIKRLKLMYVPYLGTMKLGHALEMDVNNMSSELCENDYIEGIVISPINYPEIWRLQSRLVIKMKTDKYAEESKSKKIKGNVDKVMYLSEFGKFVTYGRFENVLSHCKETEDVKYEMADLKFLVNAMVEDIQKECNDGEKFSTEDRKYLGKCIPMEYKKYLDEKSREVLEQAKVEIPVGKKKRKYTKRKKTTDDKTTKDIKK